MHTNHVLLLFSLFTLPFFLLTMTDAKLSPRSRKFDRSLSTMASADIGLRDIKDCDLDMTCRKPDGPITVPIKGIPGPPGARGQLGKKGVDGENGPPGKGGEPGNAGERGEKGIEGLQGEPGSPGNQGPPGPPSYPGQQGLPGLPGDSGAKGEQGPRGPPGIGGLPGSDGVKGLRGQKGNSGKTGTPGKPGEPGEDGERGSKGPPGEPCIPGPTLKPIAFYAVLNNKKSNLSAYTDIHFEEVQLNIGRAFNLAKSHFDPPFAGTYFFTVEVTAQEKYQHRAVALAVARQRAETAIRPISAHGFHILHLQPGDAVYLKFVETKDLTMLGLGRIVFSGHCLFAD